jgi:hypothetical protein
MTAQQKQRAVAIFAENRNCKLVWDGTMMIGTMWMCLKCSGFADPYLFVWRSRRVPQCPRCRRR